MGWCGLAYGTERALMVAALEAGLAMILEREFGFSLADVGLVAGCSFLCGAPIVFYVASIRHKRLIGDVYVMTALAAASAFATPVLSSWFGRAIGASKSPGF